MEKQRERPIWILESPCNFSKEWHNWWTLFGSDIRAYDPKTLECVQSFHDAFFPEGMGAIEGWAISQYVMRHHSDYTYILAECEAQVPDNPDPQTGEFSIVKVEKSIWIPFDLCYWLYECSLAKNPPMGEAKERFLRTISDLSRSAF